MNVARRQVLAAGALSLLPGIASAREVGGDKRQPNIVFILADDLGYADLSCFGRRDYVTPFCDRLAAAGVRFTHSYANSPVCSATRLGLMTARYQYRLDAGLEEPIGPRDTGLPPDEPTLPGLLRKAGYRTALIGKWHLGNLPNYGPLKSGYDYFWGYRGGGIDYLRHEDARGEGLWENGHEITEDGYLTRLLGQRATQFVDAQRSSDAPFFLSLHFSAPHWPWETPDDRVEAERLTTDPSYRKLAHFDGGNMATYAEMVRRMDEQVGAVVEAVGALPTDRETIIVFSSDNGGERFSDVWPFTGRKTELLEGGIRVPTIIHWPGVFGGGRVVDTPHMTMDLSAMLAAAGGACFPQDRLPDGRDLRVGGFDERPMFWRYNHLDQKAVRLGRHKYLSIAGNEFLFDIVADPMERANLKARMPDRFNDLRTRWERWNAGMLPYRDDTFTHGFRGGEVADHFGVE
ncbi:sulfatase-like hydrolase/transferase [uncultured Croceicoccus sp.]|uniref:sulfatase family protein n=1 Tax=uncultured Croceicoccus sp. TaxID=1295329 RepID=UPI002633215E|nr:sulfatase-like hydrolase/transferase [uncultured Croceicoccus sp.]